jgi:hypothetical protein
MGVPRTSLSTRRTTGSENTARPCTPTHAERHASFSHKVASHRQGGMHHSATQLASRTQRETCIIQLPPHLDLPRERDDPYSATQLASPTIPPSPSDAYICMIYTCILPCTHLHELPVPQQGRGQQCHGPEEKVPDRGGRA